MDLLFSTSGQNSSKSSVKDSDFEDYFPGVNQNMRWKTLKPYIAQATRKYLTPYISRPMYDQLADDYKNDNISEGSVQEELLDRLRESLAYYTIYHAMPSQNVVFSDSGVGQNEAQNTRPSEAWRFKNARWNIMLHADQTLDSLLEWMESQVEDGEAYLDPWKNSDQYTRPYTDFFLQTSELQRFIDVKNSRRTFHAVSPYIRKAESHILRQLLCDTLYDDIVQKVRDNNIQGNDVELLKRIRAVAAEKGMLNAIPHLRVNVEGDGIYIITATDDMITRKEAYEEVIAGLEQQLDKDYKTARIRLKNFLIEHQDDYPGWKDSPCGRGHEDYEEPTPPEFVAGGKLI